MNGDNMADIIMTVNFVSPFNFSLQTMWIKWKEDNSWMDDLFRIL